MKIYCSGIGGIGLSAYAALQQANGHTVHGSDRAESIVLEDLRCLSIGITLQQDGSHLSADTDLFVYSEAIPASSPERLCAEELGISQMSYFQALGALTKDAFVIAVCGTHGKSSTTAMAARVLIECGKDPTVVVGTRVKELGEDGNGRNWRKGQSDIVLVEACEYRKSFHFLSPDIILCTNVDGDHFDAFSSIEDYQQAFVDFFRLLPDGGKVIVHGGERDALRLVKEAGKTAVDADTLALPELLVPGLHMRQNAQLALALAGELGIPQEEARRSVQGFSGTWRRMEQVGFFKGDIPVIDDYGHHPREIAATISAMREAYPDRRLVCIFQPHTQDRTKKFYQEFTEAFREADFVLLSDIYNARSDIERGEEVDMTAFATAIEEGSETTCLAAGDLSQTEAMIRTLALPGDILLVMGAGNITELAANLARKP